jgi:Ca2+-binding EF-hand superfamily protein
LTHALRSTDALAKSGFAAEIPPEALEELIAASDLYGEGYVDVDEFLAAMLANSNYTKTKDAVSTNQLVLLIKWCTWPTSAR